MLPDHTQRFRPTGTHLFGARPPEWEVVDVYTAHDGIDYARIRRVGVPPEEKTIAAGILNDPRRYQKL